MEIKEFIEKLIKVYSCVFEGSTLDNAMPLEEKRTCFDFFNSFFESVHKKKFIDITVSSEGVLFYLKEISKNQLLLSKDDFKEIDPCLYIYENSEKTSTNANVSTIFLTEYVFWMHLQNVPQFKLKFKGYGIYNKLKERWVQYFNPINYPNKIWTSKNNESVILILNELREIICLSQSQEIINETRGFLSNE